MHANPLLADWVTEKIGDGWITDLSQMDKLKAFADDKKAQAEFVSTLQEFLQKISVWDLQSTLVMTVR